MIEYPCDERAADEKARDDAWMKAPPEDKCIPSKNKRKRLRKKRKMKKKANR